MPTHFKLSEDSSIFPTDDDFLLLGSYIALVGNQSKEAIEEMKVKVRDRLVEKKILERITEIDECKDEFISSSNLNILLTGDPDDESLETVANRWKPWINATDDDLFNKFNIRFTKDERDLLSNVLEGTFQAFVKNKEKGMSIALPVAVAVGATIIRNYKK